MITEYIDGNGFLEENLEFLNTNENLTSFIRFGAPRINYVTKENYVFRCEIGDKKLVVLRRDPFGTLFFGDKECVKEAIQYIVRKRLFFKSYLCELSLGEEILKTLDKRNIHFYESISLDYMKATKKIELSSNEVVIPSIDDLDDIVECYENFVKDCNLLDPINRETIKEKLSNFRVIKENNKVVSMAEYMVASNKDLKIAGVYTRPEYRGKSYARRVVNTLKNEILDKGYNATLNVDRHNPITNHLYSSLGFKRMFSQSEYRLK